MRVTLIGSGNVATHIAMRLKEQGVEIACIYSRTFDNACALASRVGSMAVANKSDIPQSDLYICSVKDDNITDALSGINFGSGIVAHTAGSVDMKVLESLAKNIGVIYPMQTFSKSKHVDWEKIPLFTEANTDTNLIKINEFASILSKNITIATSKQRKIIHLSSVFVCNLTNHLYSVAYRLMKSNGLEFQTLFPLIDETVSKIKVLEPAKAQTGPAVRGDEKVMKMQQEMICGYDLEIYKTISKAIQLEHEQLQRETSQN